MLLDCTIGYNLLDTNMLGISVIFVNVNAGCPGHILSSFMLRRQENPEVGQEGSAKTSLFGSLKSLASGIRNFWRNL